MLFHWLLSIFVVISAVQFSMPDNGMHAPRLIGSIQNSTDDIPDPLYALQIRWPSGEEGVLVSEIHGSPDGFLELFTTQKRAFDYWITYGRFVAQPFGVELSWSIPIPVNDLSLLLRQLASHGIYHRLDPRKASVDAEGRDIWNWNHLVL
jgi:hypothetical protein